MARKPKNGSNSQIPTAQGENPTQLTNLALGILLGYLRTRLGITNPKLEIHWKKLHGAKEFPRILISSPLRSGPTEIDPTSLREIAELVNALLIANPKVQIDYPLISRLLYEANFLGNGSSILTDHTHRDATFLDLLGFREHQDIQHQMRLEARISGYWHVIRESTDDDTPYNVSFLSIKPLEYPRENPLRSIDEVKTSVLHFSLWSRQKTAGAPQLFHGRIVEVDDVIYFLGNRDDVPRVVLMAWDKPSVSAVLKTHADFAEGLIMTINSSNKPVCLPIVSQLVEKDAEGIVWNPPFTLTPAQRVEFHDKKISEGKARVSKYSSEKLNERFSVFNDSVSIDDLIERLTGTKSKGKGRFFGV